MINNGQYGPKRSQTVKKNSKKRSKTVQNGQQRSTTVNNGQQRSNVKKKSLTHYFMDLMWVQA